MRGGSKKHPMWSEIEDRAIREWYSAIPAVQISYISTQLGRTPNSVACRAGELGLKKKWSVRAGKPYRSTLEVACDTCRKSFRRASSKIKSETRFCSRKCVQDNETQYKKHVAALLSGKNSYSRAKRGWREIAGKRVFFRSRMEANVARYLTFSGIEWEYEPKTFWFENIRRGVRSYTPDFYFPKTQAYMECKGWMDPKSVTKLKRMKKYYPEIKVELMDDRRYKFISKKLKHVIKDWEI